MFIKHGSPEPITHIIESSDKIDDLSAKKALEDLKKKSLEEDTSDLKGKNVS